MSILGGYTTFDAMPPCTLLLWLYWNVLLREYIQNELTCRETLCEFLTASNKPRDGPVDDLTSFKNKAIFSHERGKDFGILFVIYLSSTLITKPAPGMAFFHITM